MTEVKFLAETEEVANGTKMFLTTYKEQLTQFLMTIITNEGKPVDPGVKVENGVLTIYEIDPDKGFVLGETEASTESLPLQLMKYENLGEGMKYVSQAGDKLYLSIKEPLGQPDPKLGIFKTLNDAVSELNSESVKEQIKRYVEKRDIDRKAEAKTEKRLERLGKHKEVAIHE